MCICFVKHSVNTIRERGKYSEEQTLLAAFQASYWVFWWVRRGARYTYGLEGKAVAFLWPVKNFVTSSKEESTRIFCLQAFVVKIF